MCISVTFTIEFRNAAIKIKSILEVQHLEGEYVLVHAAPGIESWPGVDYTGKHNFCHK
jgi:hypothetical protein